MKKLKKALSLTLALALSLALAVPAFAAEIRTDFFTVATDRDVIKTTSDVWNEGTEYENTVTVYHVPVGTTVLSEGSTEDLLLADVCHSDKSYFQEEEYAALKGLNIGETGGPGLCYTPFQIVSEDYYVIRAEAMAGMAVLKGVASGQPEQPTEPTVPAEPEQPTDPSAVTTVEVAASNNQRLNVRSGPGTNYKIAAPALKNGTVLQISEISGQWGKLADGRGWVYLPATRTISKPAAPAETEQPAAPAETEQPAAPAEAGSYTAKKGDTWSSICTNFYGNNAQRYNLMNANKGVALKEGAVITLPAKLGKDALIPAPAAAEGEKLYTVVRGDTLGKIAAAEYGKVSEYKAIFERNADRLKNADTIYEGQVIVLPAKK